MISAGDFRNGMCFEMDDQVYQVVEFQHVKPGKGAAFVRTKLRNVINGGVVEKTFRPTEKFPAARIDRIDMQYLYKDGDMYNFMDTENYEQIALNEDQIGDALKNMNDSTVEVRTASQEMSIGNKAILQEVQMLQNATIEMKSSMEEMSVGARKINETGAALTDIAGKMRVSINEIGNQVDKFKV